MARHRGKHDTPLRRAGESVLDIVLLRGLAARLSYVCGMHGRLGVTRHEITLDASAPLPRPLTIAFASDFHAGPTTDPAIFASMFEEIERQQPDVLLLGGDFVSFKARYLPVLAAGLARCVAPLGKYAVFGNHDLWTDDASMERMLAAAGVEVLVNRNTVLPAPFESVSVCGMDNPWTGAPDAALTFDGAAAVRLLLMHAPDGLLLTGAHRFDVGFAGHTHGGQIARRDGTPLLLPAGPLCRQYYHGRYEVRGNGPLIVSRGIGCSTLPVRINADPELVICTLSPCAA
jgi:predicted MPP superfamily phosphohydrolase